ncbi:Leucine-rich receptor-like protein kinase family protein [Rhynchospora pubera]|uniref:Receptor kinase-like protein Xa21 n=1 Tax=Rhynchospora pubera TaxID=906938 RepID=A0AAV8DRL6_9POAL|nr:Leucine-rich receptor-like protein kinase family protein [Rhynchospora pubera]
MISKYERVSYNDIFRATCGFSLENLIGSGTFGVVYKAVMSFKTVQTVAVKVLNLNQHGAFKSFLSECEALRNARHRNLIKILSVCSSIDHHGNDFKALVFEFMPNGSLETWLHPNSYANQLARCLSLIQRVNIAIDIAMALEYLHDHKPMPIIHCDLKPSNVLLDENMTAHVGDFGLARFLVQPDTTPAQSITSTHGIKGSIGYIPPEYGMGGQASPQGDVYSYGILLLEMFTALSPTDERFRDGLSLSKHVEMAFPDQVMDILDINLSSTDHAIEDFLDCLVSVIRCGLLCSRELAKERITMNDVVKELNLVRAKLVRVKFNSRVVGIDSMLFVSFDSRVKFSIFIYNYVKHQTETHQKYNQNEMTRLNKKYKRKTKKKKDTQGSMLFPYELIRNLIVINSSYDQNLVRRHAISNPDLT